MRVPELNSRWVRPGSNKGEYDYNGYTVIGITNTENIHPDHPPQVVYLGDNGKLWSLSLYKWPGKLVPEE